jgi:arylsulfatase
MSSHGAGVGDMYFKRAFDNGQAVPEGVADRAGNPSYAGYLRDSVATLPEVLRGSGYRTYMVGKWDLGRALVEEHIPANRGFDRSFALLTGTAIHLGEPNGRARGGVARADYFVYRHDDQVVRELPEDFYTTRSFADEMIGFLSEHTEYDQPFFAYFAPTAPHWPLQLPDPENTEYAGTYDEGYDVLAAKRLQSAHQMGVISDDLLNNPAPWDEAVPDWRSLSADEQATAVREMQLYAGMITDLDEEPGRIFEYLASAGEMDNTLVLFMSDNGASRRPTPLATYLEDGWDNSYENIGNYDSFAGLSDGWAHATMAGFRSLKGSAWEGGTRVAAFAAGAGVTESGSVEDQWLSVTDVMPTILDLAGAEDPSETGAAPAMTGRSFAALLAGEEMDPGAASQPVPSEFSANRWIVQGDWKAVWPAAQQQWQLYNLAEDPAEQFDRSANQSERLDSLVTAWEAWAEEMQIVGSATPTDQP